MEDQKEADSSISHKLILPKEILKTVDMKMRQNNHQNKCQYQAPNCQKIATYQHHQKLGAVTINKQWVCGKCKQALESKAK